MWNFLRYITNNEAQSRHEEVFDGIFWFIETLALLFGIWILHAKHSSEWIPFLDSPLPIVNPAVVDSELP